MKIAIVGAGAVGTLYARQWVEAGHVVALSFARDEARLRDLAARLGPSTRVASPAEAAAWGDVVVFAPPFEHIRYAASLVGDVTGKVVVDTTNPFNPERDGLVDLKDGTTAAAMVAEQFPAARVVKALHSLSVAQVAESLESKGEPAVLFIAGDDGAAKAVVRDLVLDAGLVPIDTGAHSTAVLSEAPGPLFMNRYTADSADAALREALGRAATE